MRIKVLIVTFILFTAMAAKAHGFGLGAQFNYSAGEVFAPGAALTISPSRRMHFAVNWYLDSSHVNTVGVTMDILVLPIIHSGFINFTLGGGLFSNVVFDDDIAFNGGVRVPVGLNLLLLRRRFEIFTHVAPSLGLDFLPNLEFTKPFFPMALGARVWFR